MKLPKKIKVGPFDYEVGMMDRVYAAEQQRKAECDRFLFKIDIHPDLPDDGIKEALMHEIIHAVYHAGGLCPGDDEERVAYVMGVFLAQVFKDNPALLEVFE